MQLLSFIVESGGRQPPIDDEDLEDDMDDFEEVDHPALDTIPTTLFQATPPLHQWQKKPACAAATITTTTMTTSTTSEVWKKQQQRKPQRDLEVEHDDDVPPEVPKRTSSKVKFVLWFHEIFK